jgi:hypothetical protein
MGAAARNLSNQIRAAVQERFPREIRLWPQPNWPLTLPDGRRVPPPVKGLCDLSGIIWPHGRRLEIELKVIGDRMRADQVSFRELIVLMGGVHIEGRSPDQVVAELERVI